MAEAAPVRARSARWFVPPSFRLLQLVVIAVVSESLAQPQAGAARGNVPDDLSKACQKAEEADSAERALATDRRSPALENALGSETAFWSFLIDPSTPYLDRMAAAYQGGSRVSPEQLPRLWKAYAEFEVLPSGVVPMPCEFIDNAWGLRSPAVWAMRNRVPVQGTVSLSGESRNLLGFEVRLPERAIDYPLDVGSRGNAPWVWQVSRALTVLVAKVRQYYADPDRYGSMTEVALRWHPDNFYEKRVRNDALAFGPRNAAWVRTQMKLALDERVGAEVLYAWGEDSFHLEELMHVAHIAILERTDDPDVALTSSRMLGGMASVKPGIPEFARKPLRTATSILAIARWAVTRDMSVNSRYYLLGYSICQMVQEPPFKPNFQLPDNGPEEVEALVAFEKWFAGEQTRLKQEAAKEIAHLNDLAAELGTRVELPMVDRKQPLPNH